MIVTSVRTVTFNKRLPFWPPYGTIAGPSGYLGKAAVVLQWRGPVLGIPTADL